MPFGPGRSFTPRGFFDLKALTRATSTVKAAKAIKSCMFAELERMRLSGGWAVSRKSARNKNNTLVYFFLQSNSWKLISK